MSTAKTYIAFVRLNMDILVRRVTDDAWILKLAEVGLYTFQTSLKCLLLARDGILNKIRRS